MRIEHVVLYVSDLERARAFFVRYLGGGSNALYYNEKTGSRSYFISFSDGARLGLMTKPDPVLQDKTLYRAGYAHLAFPLGSKEEVDTLIEQLGTAGYKVISRPHTTGGGYYESYIPDSEGDQIELTMWQDIAKGKTRRKQVQKTSLRRNLKRTSKRNLKSRHKEKERKSYPTGKQRPLFFLVEGLQALSFQEGLRKGGIEKRAGY